MKEHFKKHLIDKGYSQYTPSGNPSTVYDYPKRIDRVCEWEGLDWLGLANNIDTVLPQYDLGGAKEEKGRMSNNAVINALRRFSEFLMHQQV